jgi:RNA polymerase sigma factor (sigma-70 family)
MTFENAVILNVRHADLPADPQPQQLSESKLVAAAKGGQSAAFGELCERYGQQLLRAAHRITRSHEDAEDAVQDAMLRAFVHLREFDGRSTFGTWLTRIAINSALMILRKKRSSLLVAVGSTNEFGTGALNFELPDRAPNPERRYAQREEKQILKKAVQKLRPALRQVINIQHVQEGSMRETAKAMGISVAAAKARLFHAKAALRRAPVIKMMRRRRPAAAPISVLTAA